MKEVFTALTISALHSQIETFMEEHDTYEWENVTIVTEKVYDETAPFEYRWKATLTPETEYTPIDDTDDENQNYLFNTTSIALLKGIISGKINTIEIAKRELGLRY